MKNVRYGDLKRSTLCSSLEEGQASSESSSDEPPVAVSLSLSPGGGRED